MTPWRLLDTGDLSASFNMAIDEALLRLHVPGESRPTLRFYRWSPAAVSLGYFQKRHAIDLYACRKLGLEVVRRTTGGGAVLHQNDLTYSVVADSGQGIPSSLDAAYRLLCKGLLAGFRRLGFEAEIGREETASPPSDICFVHAAIADIVYQGRKFVGSAQTWQGASLLQHGSIVLEPQEETWSVIIKTDSQDALRAQIKSRITSLREILGRGTDLGELKGAIMAGLTEVLHVEFETDELSTQEWALAIEIASSRSRRREAQLTADQPG